VARAAIVVRQRDVRKRHSPKPRRRLIVPLVLAVTTIGTVAVSTSTGCSDDNPSPVDAGIEAIPTPMD
jgi:hypothetical protein